MIRKYRENNIIRTADEILDIIADIEENAPDARYCKEVIGHLKRAEHSFSRGDYESAIDWLYFAADAASNVGNREKGKGNYLHDEVLSRIYNVMNEIKPGTVTTREEDKQYVL